MFVASHTKWKSAPVIAYDKNTCHQKLYFFRLNPGVVYINAVETINPKMPNPSPTTSISFNN